MTRSEMSACLWGLPVAQASNDTRTFTAKTQEYLSGTAQEL